MPWFREVRIATLSLVITTARRPALPSTPLRALRPAAPIGWLRPSLPGSGLPAPESRTRRWAIRGIAVTALLVTVVYLVWRATSTLDASSPWLSIALLVLEIHAALGLGLFTFSLWDVDRRPAVNPVTTTTARIAVLIPTYNEGTEVLTPTIAAAVAIRLPHETWVLDDGNRAEVGALAAKLGARYLTRPTHEHAKAGNLNHALEQIDAEFVAILDADHVAEPDFLVHTLGYFEDRAVALVQTPQEFYNTDSFEHETGGSAGDRFHEQTLFYRVLQAGKNRWGGAFWCGTGAVVRIAALRDVGGVATDTITEDIHTTIRLHRRGWRTVYHNEVLARGLAASDADTYQLQRHRWGTGAMQVLRVENPMFVPGLSLGQRLSYATTLLGWFDAWRSLGYHLLPAAVVMTGAVPIRAEPTLFVGAFTVTFVLQQLAMRVLSRGCHRPVLSVLFELVRMAPNLLATISLVRGKRATFRVTPKGRTGRARQVVQESRLLRGLALLSLAAAAWFGLTLLGLTPTRYVIPWAAYGAFGWLVVNVLLLVAAIRRVRSHRYAAERRASYRFTTTLAGRLDGGRVSITDVSLTGARVVAGSAVAGQPARLVIQFPSAEVAMDAIVRSVTPKGEAAIVGLEYLPDQDVARARLALGLFEIDLASASLQPVGALVAA